MKRRSLRIALASLAAVLATLAVAQPSGSDEAPRRVRPGWGRRAAAIPPAPAVEPAAPPASLRREVPTDPEADAAPRPVPSTERPDVRTLAAEAAWTLADGLARHEGRVWYYRAGFWEGLRRALAAPGLGAWDRREGERDGRRDPMAADRGEELGMIAAERNADRRAVDDVATAFRDLSREPGRDPRFAVPPYTPSGPWAETPILDDVYLDCTLERVLGSRGEWREAFEGWDWTPRRLAGVGTMESFHDSRWDDPDRAYELERRRGRSRWAGLAMTPEEAARFREVFRFRFAERIAFLEKTVLARAWDRGWREGWSYGAFVVTEMAYREGYADGFDRAVADTAARAFHATYPEVYASAFGREFARWSRAPHVEILEAAVSDEDDDGIQEPGESLAVALRLVNFGGVDGSVPVRLAGRGIESPVETAMAVRARSVLDRPEPLVARVRPDAEAGSSATLRVSAGADAKDLRVPIAYPLVFTRDVAVARDTLAGRASIEVEVRNRGRKPVRARVAVEGGTAKSLGDLGAGGRGKARFEVEGLRPLDILAGKAAVRFTVGRGDTPHDTLDYRFHRVAVDLGSDDLLDLLVVLARDRSASPADIGEARALLIDRLRADWDAAADGSGNPYRDDVRADTDRTALGALVRTVAEHRRSFVRPDVFGGLRGEVTALSDALPGAHPNLRRWFRRLAQRL